MNGACQLVMMEWVDSAQPSSEWQRLSEYKNPEIVRCVSVGWLIYDGDEVKALAQNMGDVGQESMQVSGIIRIPARCVVRTVELPEPEVTVSSFCSAPLLRPETEPMPRAS